MHAQATLLELKVLFRQHTSEEHRTPKFIYNKAGQKRGKAQAQAESEPEPIQDEPQDESAPEPVQDDLADGWEEEPDRDVVEVASLTATEPEDDLPEPSSSSKAPDLLYQQVAATPCRALVFGKGWQGHDLSAGLIQITVSMYIACPVHALYHWSDWLQVMWRLSSKASR